MEENRFHSAQPRAEPLRSLQRSPLPRMVICKDLAWAICLEMAPPKKRQRHLHMLMKQKQQKLAIENADRELVDHVDEDEDFDLDGMALESALVQSRWESLMKWNPAADHAIRAAYTGDSRATKYRRLKEKQDRHASVANCPKIQTFFRKALGAELSVTEFLISFTVSHRISHFLFDKYQGRQQTC